MQRRSDTDTGGGQKNKKKNTLKKCLLSSNSAKEHWVPSRVKKHALKKNCLLVCVCVSVNGFMFVCLSMYPYR